MTVHKYTKKEKVIWSRFVRRYAYTNTNKTWDFSPTARLCGTVKRILIQNLLLSNRVFKKLNSLLFQKIINRYQTPDLLLLLSL